MALPQNQLPANAQEAVMNLAKALGVEIEIKGTQEQIEGPQKEVTHRKGRKLPKVLKHGEPQKMMDSFKLERFADLRDRCAFQSMYSSGLRIMEICNLTIDDVDLDEGYFNVQQSKGKVDRTVPMDEETIDWLKKWQEVRPDSQWFFCTKKGGQLDTRQLREKVYRISERSGVYLRDGQEKKKVNPHALRHTCFTECLEEGLTVKEIQELAGHASIQTTSVYLSVRPDALKQKMRNRKKKN